MKLKRNTLYQVKLDKNLNLGINPECSGCILKTPELGIMRQARISLIVIQGGCESCENYRKGTTNKLKCVWLEREYKCLKKLPYLKALILTGGEG